MSELRSENSSRSSEPSALDTYWQFTYVNSRKNVSTMLKVVANAEDVFINKTPLKEITEKVMKYVILHCNNNNFFKIAMNTLRRLNNYYPIEVNNKVADWLFVLNALNFSLWNPQDNKQWTVHRLTGYKALCFVIQRAIREGKPLWDPYYYSKITRKEVEEIFRSEDGEAHIALIDERVKVLHEIGKVLLDKYYGTFITCMEVCGGDPIKLWCLLYDDFESYRDQVTYRGKTIYFACKIKALLSDLAHVNLLFMGRMRYTLSTMFIDYCAPRVLLHLGLLRYSDRLKTKIRNAEPLENGSREDMEIRCCSFIAVRILRSYILKKLKNISRTELEVMSNYLSNLIDSFLWSYRHMMDELKSADKYTFAKRYPSRNNVV